MYQSADQDPRQSQAFQKEMSQYDQLRRRADAVRNIPLETVLVRRGASRGRHDKAKWDTEQGPVSVTGMKFFDWHQGLGGGGAIDLVMHLAQADFSTAVDWLENYCVVVSTSDRFSSAYQTGEDVRRMALSNGSLCIPARDDRKLGQVRRYLQDERQLPSTHLVPLIESGSLYADPRGNAVFLLLGSQQRTVGAELRGTGARVWRGMARGTQKNRGFFWIGAQDLPGIVLCESAIDAISCFALSPDRICISTSGARPGPGWLGKLIKRDYDIYCGFDADEVGDEMARQMIHLHPSVKRLSPPGHDWNDVLTARI
jgi:hypothetical protein